MPDHPAEAPDLAAIRVQLAAIEHDRWAHWQRWMHSQCVRDSVTDSLLIPGDLVRRWERQIATEYADLSPGEQASDLEQVDRYWPIIQGLLDAQRPWRHSPHEEY